MLTKEFSFEYPTELVAQEPLPERDAARMMVLDRGGNTIGHSFFREFPSYFKRGDLLILNNTKVLPARLWGKKKTGGKVEVLLVGRWRKGREGFGSNIWDCLFRSMKGLRDGEEIHFKGKNQVSAFLRSEDKTRMLEFSPEVSVLDLMKEQGAAPLPPYIKRREARSEDLERYQTVFAEREGAIAAPTASLHFTSRVLSGLKERGVEILYVTLHVGVGTFHPVMAERVEDHRMQTEFYEIGPSVVQSVLLAKKEGRPVTAVGTTTVRAVESYFNSAFGVRRSGPEDLVLRTPNAELRTDLFITPGYQFKVIDRLLTNFHQPESTPLFLTCAFAGKEFVLKAYQEAFEKKYRLFSYGDCMWIL